MEQVDTTVIDTLGKTLDTAKNVADSAATIVANSELTTSGIIFMSVSWAFIIALCIFCFAKVLGGKDKK